MLNLRQIDKKLRSFYIHFKLFYLYLQTISLLNGRAGQDIDGNSEAEKTACKVGWWEKDVFERYCLWVQTSQTWHYAQR